MGKDRGYQDGGGLCSPGRWPRSQRHLPDGVNKELLIMARAGQKKSVARTSAGDSPLTLMLKLAAGMFAATPFDPEVVEERRMKIAKLLCCKEDRLKVDEHQVLRLPLIADLLTTLRDPASFREVEGGRASRSRLRFPEDACSFSRRRSNGP